MLLGHFEVLVADPAEFLGLPKAAEDVIRVYRQNMLFVEESTARYNLSKQKEKETTITVTPAMASVSNSQIIDNKIFSNESWYQSYSFPLSKDARAELNIRGELTNEGLDLLKDHIALVIRALRSQAKPQPSGPLPIEEPDK